jgi:TonB family protein
MKRLTSYIFTRFFITAILLLFAGSMFLAVYADERDKIREKASSQYSAGNFAEAKKYLLELIDGDTNGRFWMDYAMLCNIYLGEGNLDSAKNIIEVGISRSGQAEDQRITRRNHVVWENLSKQLKHKTDNLTFPKFERLELYADERMDSLQQMQEIDQKLDELLFASTINKPVISQPSIANEMQQQITAGDSTDSSQQTIPLPDEAILAPSVYPRLAGGIVAVNQFINDNALYPDTALTASIPYGAAVARIKVDTAGTPTDIDIIRVKPDSLGFGELAIELFRNMKYIPAESEGKKISSEFQVPVLFKAPESENKSKEN